MTVKNYLHLYLGCEVQVEEWRLTSRLVDIIEEGNKVVVFNEDIGRSGPFPLEWIKPILRPLSSMVHEELQECGNMIYDFSNDPELNDHKWQDFEICLAPEQFKWLLSKHFDLFGLIESGLAIDKTKIEQTS